jgi:hypothetical protein
MKRLLLIILIIFVALGAGCGGGFSPDSTNAAGLAPTIFGAPADTAGH